MFFRMNVRKNMLFNYRLSFLVFLSPFYISSRERQPIRISRTPATDIDIVLTLHELLTEPAFQGKNGKDRIIVLDDCTKHLEVANLYQKTISLLKTLSFSKFYRRKFYGHKIYDKYNKKNNTEQVFP